MIFVGDDKKCVFCSCRNINVSGYFNNVVAVLRMWDV